MCVQLVLRIGAQDSGSAGPLILLHDESTAHAKARLAKWQHWHPPSQITDMYALLQVAGVCASPPDLHETRSDVKVVPNAGVLEGGRHPAWGSQTEHTAMQALQPQEASPDGQLDKWGFVPGAEDTMDLNLEDQGTHPKI